MKNSILTAIESICDDIATGTNAGENLIRAITVAMLTASGSQLPEEDEPLKVESNELTAESEDRVNSHIPKPGENFQINGFSFVALGEEQGGLLAIAAKPLEERMPFDEDDRNDWRESSLRKYLNGEYLDKDMKAGLLPFTSDLTADDGMKDYGTSEDYVFLLSADLYRKYRAFIPRYNVWWWLITPDSCHSSYTHYARVVNADGSLNGIHVITGNAVAPACLFNPAIFEQSVSVEATQ